MTDHKFSQRAIAGLRCEYAPLELSFSKQLENQNEHAVACSRMHDIASGSRLFRRASDAERTALAAEGAALEKLVSSYEARRDAARCNFQSFA